MLMWTVIAGTTYPNKPTLEVTGAEFDRVFNVNVRSIFLSVQAVVPQATTPWVGWVQAVTATESPSASTAAPATSMATGVSSAVPVSRAGRVGASSTGVTVTVTVVLPRAPLASWTS